MFVNVTEIYKFKAKDFEIVASPLCLGNISKDWSTDNMRYVNGFSVDYNVADVDDIKNIHKYFMKKKWYSVNTLVIIKIFIKQNELHVSIKWEQ